MQIKKDHINFAVGPVQISADIANLGADPVPYFRTPEFSALMKENEALMKKFLHAEEDARVVFLTGSGTAAMEAAVVGLFTQADYLLVVNGGGFGQRFCDICALHDIPYDAIPLKYGQGLSKEQLYAYSGRGYTGLLVNIDETTSGVLYDIELLGRFCRENNMLFVVDAISSFLADKIDMQEMGIDAVLTGSQKALAIPPGVSILALNGRSCQLIEQNKPKSYYLNLQSALKNGERGQTPFTPAVGILIQLNARLNQIAERGFETEQARIAARAKAFREKILNYPFRLFTETPSNALTALCPVNPSVSAHRLFELLRDEYGIIICPNGGELAETVFRIGHIGEQSAEDYDALFQAFDDLMRRGILFG